MYKAQTVARETANKKLKAERHQKRMTAQCGKTVQVPRGTERNARRYEKQMDYSDLI